MDNLFVKSLGEHWSAGIKWRLGSSTRRRIIILQPEFLPSVEYGHFPLFRIYSQATSEYYMVQESSIIIISTPSVYNMSEETLGKQSLSLAFQIQKKWAQ